MDVKQFGDFLKQQRKEKKMTTSELAELSGLSQSYISNVENGRRSKPKAETIKKFSKGLGLSYVWLLEVAGLTDTKMSGEEFFLLPEEITLLDAKKYLRISNDKNYHDGYISELINLSNEYAEKKFSDLTIGKRQAIKLLNIEHWYGRYTPREIKEAINYPFRDHLSVIFLNL